MISRILDKIYIWKEKLTFNEKQELLKYVRDSEIRLEIKKEKTDGKM